MSPATSGHQNMGLLPYASQGQPLVFWTEHYPSWCGQTACEQWRPCDVNSDLTAIPPDQNRCHNPAAPHPLSVAGRTGSGTFAQWNWPDSRFPDHKDGNIRLDDHEMVFANIRVHPDNTYLRTEMREALTDTDRRSWASASSPSFSCGGRETGATGGVWLCFSMAMAGEGVDEFEWIQTRAIRVGVQYRLPRWGNVLVSTMERTDANARGAKIYPVAETLVAGPTYPY